MSLAKLRRETDCRARHMRRRAPATPSYFLVSPVPVRDEIVQLVLALSIRQLAGLDRFYQRYFSWPGDTPGRINLLRGRCSVQYVVLWKEEIQERPFTSATIRSFEDFFSFKQGSSAEAQGVS